MNNEILEKVKSYISKRNIYFQMYNIDKKKIKANITNFKTEDGKEYMKVFIFYLNRTIFIYDVSLKRIIFDKDYILKNVKNKSYIITLNKSKEIIETLSKNYFIFKDKHLL